LRGDIFRVQIRFAALKAWFLVAIILLSYFLFNSGWVWAVATDIPTSPIIDHERMATLPDLRLKASYFGRYIIAEDVAGTSWLTSHFAAGRFLCADYVSRNRVLTSYGGFLGEDISALPYACRLGNYIYLNILNTRYGVAMQSQAVWLGYDPELDATLGNRIYSNDATTIYGGG
jgi:uncharacterized membrane protein